MKLFAFCLLIFFVSGCQDDDCCQVDPDIQLVDRWLLYERGYSPGAGYIVEPVSAVPPQTIDLQADGRFSSNIPDLERYQYFLILQDGDQEILSLYESQPDEDDQDINSLRHSYMVEYHENNTVKLYFRFCFEGCHLGFKRLD